jgi:hypothetical protein
MSYSKEKTKEFTSEDFDRNYSAQIHVLETSTIPLEQVQPQRENVKKASAYSLGFRIVVGLFLASLLFIAAIYYGLIDP